MGPRSPDVNKAAALSGGHGTVRVPLLVERALLQDVPALVAAMMAEGLDSAEVCAARPAWRVPHAAQVGTAWCMQAAGCSPAERSAPQHRHGARGTCHRASQPCPRSALYLGSRQTPGTAPRARGRSHAPDARPQAEQAAYLSIGGQHVDSPAAWALYMGLTGSPAEPLAVVHLQFREPEAALGACAPAGVCPPAQAGTWADELALRALATAYGRVVIAVRPWALLCQGAPP
jgi:hypothetical protein